MKRIAIILAGGTSSRCGFDKLFIENPKGVPVIFQTLKIFQNCENIDEIILVLNSEKCEILQKKYKNNFSKFSKIKKILPGGKERIFSLKNAINFCEKNYKKNCHIIVHNAANANLCPKDLAQGIDFAKKKKNVIFGFFTPNSIKKVQKNIVVDFLDRSEIFETQTPQISDLETFKKSFLAFKKIKNNFFPKDEAELLNLINEKIFIFECSEKNTKITFPSDL